MKMFKKIMAAALVGAMAFTATAVVNYDQIVTEAADSVLPTNSPYVSVAKTIDKEAGTVTVVLGWNSEEMRTFDYGVLFDETKLEFDGMSLSEDFLDAYQWDGAASEGGAAEYGEVTDATGKYITFGGVYYGTQKYNGEIATLNFKMKEDAEGAGILTIVKDSSTYETVAAMKEATPFKKVDLDSDVLIGDVDNSGEVDSDDAVEVLKHFAGLKTLTGDEFVAGDVDYNEEVDSDDAVQILRYFAGLSSVIG